MSAFTTTSSPTVRLIGKRPPSTSGVTAAMTTRFLPSSGHLSNRLPLVHNERVAEEYLVCRPRAHLTPQNPSMSRANEHMPYGLGFAGCEEGPAQTVIF